MLEIFEDTLPQTAQSSWSPQLGETVNADPAYRWSAIQKLVNLGAIIRYADGGIGVVMLHAVPGVWYDERGRQVGPAIARRAGYDTTALLEQKRKREAIAKVTLEVEAQFAKAAGQREVLKEVKGYKLVHIGNERYNIEYGSDTSPVNTKGPMPKDIAEASFNAVVSSVDEEPTE